jgi:DNA-binding CsgD family transcriptional regulator
MSDISSVSLAAACRTIHYITDVGGAITQWIGLRENLQENMVFTIKYRSFL